MFGTDTPLHSLLIKPVQRIAKYPLLMKVRDSRPAPVIIAACRAQSALALALIPCNL